MDTVDSQILDQSTTNKILSKDEREVIVAQVAQETRNKVLDELNKAITEADFLKWWRVLVLYPTPKSMDWIWDCGGTTADEIIQKFKTEERDEIFQKESVFLDELKRKIDVYPSKSGFVKVALKRIRDKDGRIISYRVLAEFPTGYDVSSTFTYKNGDKSEKNTDIIFFEPESACIINACDDLYKANKKTEGVVYIPNTDYLTASSKIQGSEYIIEKTKVGKVTQDSGNYLLFALIGGFSNEKLRVKISDFWNKIRNKNNSSAPLI